VTETSVVKIDPQHQVPTLKSQHLNSNAMPMSCLPVYAVKRSYSITCDCYFLGFSIGYLNFDSRGPAAPALIRLTSLKHCSGPSRLLLTFSCYQNSSKQYLKAVTRMGTMKRLSHWIRNGRLKVIKSQT